MEQGYVKLYRKIFDNPIVSKDCETLSIWIYLLLNATHKEQKVIFNGKTTTLKSGELITGIISISEKLKINKNKIQRTLKLFENDKQIEQQTTNKNRLITVLNWGMYQNNDKQNDKQMINKWETTDKQVITNKNDKNDNNERNNIKENIIKKKYGSYKNVLLTDEEYNKLLTEYKEDKTRKLITYLDEYIEMKGYKAKSHYLCIKKWVVKALKENKEGVVYELV
jgi:DNA-binding transcriptional MocR family regulator